MAYDTRGRPPYGGPYFEGTGTLPAFRRSDIHPQDAQAMHGIIDHFERQGRRFVGVNELLTDKYLGP